jgi:hypothetical protein
MRDPYKKYEGIAYRELRPKLMREGLSEQEAEDLILDIKRTRAVQATSKRQQKELAKQWGEVIEALQHERRILRGMVRYKPKTPAPEREEFVAHYYAALTTLYEKLCKKRSLEQELPEHSHWTDFVPRRVKDALIEAANAVPPRDRAKIKEPFQRISPINLSIRRRERLLRATRSTLESLLVKQDLNVEDTQTGRTADPRVNRKEWLLRKAIDRINALPNNAHVPNHWADMVRDMLEPADDTSTAKLKKKLTKREKNAKALADQETHAPVGMPKADFESWKEMQQRFTKLMVKQPISETIKNLLK